MQVALPVDSLSMTTKSKDFHVTAVDAEFRERAIVHLRSVQSAWLDLLSTSDLRRARPTEISRRLGMTSSMAWKIWKFAHTSDVSQASKHLPGAGGVQILLKAARANGVPKKCVDEVHDADRALRRFVSEHAGSRRTFEAMLAGTLRTEESDYEERRAMYRAGSIVWGVRARVQMGAMIIKPSDNAPGMIDTITLSGLFDFERLRADIPWIIRRSLQIDSPDHDPTARRPLVSPTSDEHSLSLIPKYCSGPLPGIRELVGPDKMVYTEIVSTPVGRSGATTTVMGDLFTDCDIGGPGAEGVFANMELHTPVEYAVNDVYIHEDLAQLTDPRVHVFSRIEHRPNTCDLENLQVALYQPTTASELGAHRIGEPRSGVPNARIDVYEEMLADAIGLAGWRRDLRFRGFRAELTYPPVPCRLTLHSELRT